MHTVIDVGLSQISRSTIELFMFKIKKTSVLNWRSIIILILLLVCPHKIVVK